MHAASDARHPQCREALGELCGTYWFPAYAFVRRRGFAADEALDLTQGFFSRLLEKGTLRSATRERGRFRSFLLASLRHFVINEWERGRAAKRGGGMVVSAVDAHEAERRLREVADESASPERSFERRWAMTVLEQAHGRLRAEVEQSAHPERARRLLGFLTGEAPSTPYGQVATELDMSESAVKVAVHRLRRRYGVLLREEVARTVDRPDRVDDELRYLFSCLES